MISLDEIFPIGQINKPHGVNGELSFTFSSDVFDTEEIPYLIMEIEGIPVPFFIDEYRFILQLIGSLIIIGFGVWIFSSNPVSQPRPDEKYEHSLLTDYVTSFGLTLSNPLILFVLIALFARFDFVTPETTVWVMIAGLVSVLIGASLWWNLLTYFVNHFRNKFNIRGLKLINQITAIVIVLIGGVGIFVSLF